MFTVSLLANLQPSKSLAQSVDATAAKGADAVPGQTIAVATRLESATHEMREHLKKMRIHAVDYHLTENSAELSAKQAQWRAMLVTGHKIHQQMIEAAVADFKENPKLDGQAAEFLIQLTGRNADVDRFDGMLPLVELLAEHGYSTPQFELCYGFTAAAQNQFDAAQPHLVAASKNLEAGLQELAELKKISEEDRKEMANKMLETFELVGNLAEAQRLNPLWQEELKARQRDAAGEPLPRVLISTTKGDFEVELFENDYPNTVANFISLCEQGFYDKLPFHRVITHFMAQGGDPSRDGTGGPGYSIRTELKGKDDRTFFRGTLGMALSAQPDSGGSQFFVCYMPRAHLNDKYVAFGRVVEGMNILSDLAHINPDDKKGETVTQDLPDEILSTKVLRKRAHAYTVVKLPASH